MVCLSDLTTPSQPQPGAQPDPQHGAQPSVPAAADAPPPPTRDGGHADRLTDDQALDAIRAILGGEHCDWRPEILAHVADVLTRTGRPLRPPILDPVEASRIVDSHGWPVGRIETRQIVVHVHQALDGGPMVTIDTYDIYQPGADDLLRVVVDEHLVYGPPTLPGQPRPDSDVCQDEPACPYTSR